MQSAMTCRELIDFLMDYLDGVLASPVSRRFEAHLEECDACQTYVATYRETGEAMVRMFCEPDDPVPEEIPENLVQAILGARKPSSST